VRHQSVRTAAGTSRTPWQPHCLDHGETQKKSCEGGFTYAENRNDARQRYSPSGNRKGHNWPGHNRAQRASAQESRSEISLEGTGFFTGLSRRLPIQTEPLDCRGSRLRLRPKLPALLFDGRISRIQANVHQATGGFVFRAPTSRKLRIDPYPLAEGGAH
jgi:hypothetical protein